MLNYETRVQLRPLNINDAEAYGHIRLLANKDELYRGKREAEKGLSLEAARQLINNNSHCYIYGAYEKSTRGKNEPKGESLLGMVSLGWLAMEFTLFGLFVRPENRRQGLAAALVDRLVLDARARGGKTLRLSVMKNNKNAIHLYERIGFTQLRRSEDSLALVLLLRTIARYQAVR